MMKPILGITMGDAAGVGPEVIVKALADEKLYESSRPVVFGDKKIMERAVKIVGSTLVCHSIESPEDGGRQYGTIDIVDLDNLPADLPFAKLDARAGKAAYEYIEAAVKYAMKQQVHAIVTAPLNKEALHMGGCPYPGHTEILGALMGQKDYSMMLVSEPLKVIHVSTHVSLRDACDLVKKERVLKVIELADETVKLMGIKKPHIAVAGLNPHSGEHGMFGTEDDEEILPAVNMAVEKGIDVQGPIPPDSVFHRAAIKREFDIVVVMYHDQGHIPLKVLGFETGVNVTVGLPCIRTSVDHGTAFPVAGQGIADSRSMTEALNLGAQMANVKFAELLK
jgi:4-hydroxythreonine-4-phosphate dehydrogenase